MKTGIKSFLVITCGLLILTSFSPAGYTIGDSVKDFKLKNTDGKMVSLTDYKSAKGFIIIFTCNHCPYAKAYEQRIMELDQKYQSKGYPVIAISSNDPAIVPDDSYENMVKRSKEKKYSFPYLFDETQAVAKEFGALKTPHVFIVSRKGGKMTVEYIGAIDDNTEDPSAVKNAYVANAVDALLAGQPVPVKESKAIGCSIKFKK